MGRGGHGQVKDYLGGKGASVKSDLKKIVQIAKDAGYRGYLPIETLAAAGEKEYDPRARVRLVLTDMRAALNQLE
jgi:hypothetical protein